MSLETRAFNDFEIRAEAGEDGQDRLIGKASVYNSLSVDFGGWRERVAPGAFSKSLESNDILALLDHDASRVVGRQSNDTLTLRDGESALDVEVTPPAVSYVRDAIELIKNQFIKGMSFGFYVRENGDHWEETEDGLIRTLLDVDLIEVSFVTFPAYPATSAEARDYVKTYLGQRGRATELAESVGRLAQRERTIELLLMEP